MMTILARGRTLLAALVLALLAPYALATTKPTQSTGSARTPAGDPELGLLIILGAIGFFILVAWIFSRTGDDGGRGPDRTLL